MEPYTDNSEHSDIAVRNFTQSTAGTAAQRPSILGDVNNPPTTARVTGFIYNNALSHVTVKNCVGKVYIRGFCVDGADRADITTAGEQRTDIGFSIHNSDVVVENCTATRCRLAGISINNSNVVLNRGFIGSHNYALSTTSTHLDTKVDHYQTPGLKAYNSNVTLSSALTSLKGCAVDSPFIFSRNLRGVELTNSQIITPPKYEYGLTVEGVVETEVYGSNTVVLQAFSNVKEGMLANNSVIDFDGRLAVFQNNNGLKLLNSTCKLAEVTIDHNQLGGLVMENCVFLEGFY